MKFKEIENLREINKISGKAKKILFVNPRRKTCNVNIPHMGLAILSAILKKRGHSVLIVDYQLIHKAPKISFFLKKFNPDVIGVSIMTSNINEANELIEEIRRTDNKSPLLVGGPHATLYPENLRDNKSIDYIVQGESEPIIIDLVEKVSRQKNPIVLQSKIIIDPNNTPYPDYKSFFRWEEIRGYPIMTSRGCPYRCSFCPVAYIGQKKWRARDPKDCINELKTAMKELNPHLHILIQDDNALVIKERFYYFLEMFEKEIKARISITNTRADDISDKFLELFKKAGGYSIGIAVESANPDVFKLVNKGETLETIDRAAKLIKKHKLLLSFCFIIGLPEDNLKRMEDSIKFTKKHNPDSVYWNMMMPYKNTLVREWFEKNGRVYNEIGKTSLSDGDFRCDEPSVETKDFTIWQRKKAHYMALFRTTDDRLSPLNIWEIFKEAKRYNELRDFFYWLPRGITQFAKRKLELGNKFLKYAQREGFKSAIKRSIFLVKES